MSLFLISLLNLVLNSADFKKCTGKILSFHFTSQNGLKIIPTKTLVNIQHPRLVLRLVMRKLPYIWRHTLFIFRPLNLYGILQ